MTSPAYLMLTYRITVTYRNRLKFWRRVFMAGTGSYFIGYILQGADNPLDDVTYEGRETTTPKKIRSPSN